MRKALLGSAALCMLSCASAIHKEHSPSSPADALLPTGKNLFVFDFSQSRYQKWPMDQGIEGAADKRAGICRLADTLKGDWGAPAHWLALPAPVQPFTPAQAVWGPSGNFFLLDRTGKRLCLYDTGAQFLSGFPLPQEIRDRNLERFQVFWTRDGVFSFLDPGEGKVWQYTELRSTTGGSGDWQLRSTINLPLGLDACVWEPFSGNPCCLRGSRTAGKALGNTDDTVGDRGKAVCFDKYFNVTGDWKDSAEHGDVHIEPVPGESGWRMVFDPGPACASASRFCFSPDKGGFSACDSTRPAPGPVPPEP